MTVTTAEPPTTSTTPTAEAERTPRELFAYSAWVHVGDGAEECDHKLDGKCDEREHFHAWVRLPTPYQIRDINEKAKAAQARRLRALRNPESDAAIILENELDELREAAESGSLGVLVEEILDQDHADDMMRATRNVRALVDEEWEPDEDGPEDQKAPPLFATVDQDFEEWQRQRELPEEERSEDWPEIQSHIDKYTEAVNAELESIREPKRAELMSRSIDQLIEIVRRDRRESDAAEVYLHTYHSWTQFVCTFKPKLKGTPNERVFKDYIQMRQETPEPVVVALRRAFEGLERNLARSRQAGNS
jgi:hypothetical protein